MEKKYDESLDYIIDNEDSAVFVEPYGNSPAVWISIQAQRDDGIKSLGTSLSIKDATALRNALTAVLAGVALPVFTVTVDAKDGEYTMDVHAKDEEAAIDCVMNQVYGHIRSMHCGNASWERDE